MPKQEQGVKPPFIGKFTGRLRTPLTIFAAFFALGVLADLIVEGISRYAKELQKRVHVGFQFWFMLEKWDYTMPDGTVVDGRETIAYDDLILLGMTLAILAIYKIRMKLRLIAAGGFFAGWYASSMWIRGYIFKPEETESSLSSEGSSTTDIRAETTSPIEQA